MTKHRTEASVIHYTGVTTTTIPFAALKEAVHTLDIRSRIEGITLDQVTAAIVEGGLRLHLPIQDGHDQAGRFLTADVIRKEET